MSLADAFERRLVRDGKSPGTAAKYRQHADVFVSWLADKDPADATRADLEDYLDEWFVAASPSRSTHRLRIASIKSFYDFLESKGFMTDPVSGRELASPAAKLKAPSRERKPIEWLHADEDGAMLDAVATPHERIVIWLLRWTGLRTGEACALTVADVDLERDEIRVRESKTASGLRTVPIVEPELKVEIQFWLRRLESKGLLRRDAPFLCTTHGTAMKPQFAWRVVKRVSERAEITRVWVSPHTLRRTFGSDLLNRGVRMEAVSKLLGHADVRVTQQAYAELLDQTVRDEVRRALAAA